MTEILEGLAALLHRRAGREGARDDAETVVRRFICALVRLRRATRR